MRRLCVGVFLIALCSLALELLLTRAFDVLLTRNLSYFIVTSAVFAIGLAGVYASLRPSSAQENVRPLLTALALVLAVVAALLVPLINTLAFNPDEVFKHPLTQIVYF